MTQALHVFHTDLSPRSRVYLQLGSVFAFPGEPFFQQLANGDWYVRLEKAFREIGFRDNLHGYNNIPDQEAFESDYIGLFEVGMGGAPCPLHSGHYARDRMKVMEEVLRFYRYFGYSWDASRYRFPDHLSVELEFMAYLSGEQAQSKLNANSCLLAQRDFCLRQLVSWVADFYERIIQNSRHEFFTETGLMLRDFIDFDYQYLESSVQAAE